MDEEHWMDTFNRIHPSAPKTRAEKKAQREAAYNLRVVQCERLAKQAQEADMWSRSSSREITRDDKRAAAAVSRGISSQLRDYNKDKRRARVQQGTVVGATAAAGAGATAAMLLVGDLPSAARVAGSVGSIAGTGVGAGVASFSGSLAGADDPVKGSIGKASMKNAAYNRAAKAREQLRMTGRKSVWD